MIHQCRARWIVGNCPVWLVRAYSSFNSVRTRFHSWEGLFGLAVPSPHALSYHALYRAIRVVVLLPNPALLRSLMERRYAVSFCRTTFEFIFLNVTSVTSPLPSFAACLVSSRACRPWTLVPSSFPCVLSLCCYFFSFYFFFLFIFDFLSATTTTTVNHHHHHYDYDYYCMLLFLFLFLYRHSRRCRRSHPAYRTNLKNNKSTPKKRNNIFFCQPIPVPRVPSANPKAPNCNFRFFFLLCTYGFDITFTHSTFFLYGFLLFFPFFHLILQQNTRSKLLSRVVRRKSLHTFLPTVHTSAQLALSNYQAFPTNDS